MNDSQIILNDISKGYHFNTILDHIDLEIHKGESVVFIGHNGTGKSTLLKIVSGLVVPESGSRTLHPGNLLFHYIPEHFPKMNLTPRDYMQHMCRLDHIPKEEQKDRAMGLFQDFFMESMIDIPMKHLSKGSLQKVGVIQSLLTRPDVLLLDEPLSGQDIDSQKVFLQKMKTLRQEGVTLLMSCHEPYLIQQMGDTVYQIQDKQLQRMAMKKQARYNSYDCVFESTKQEAGVPEQVEKHSGCIKVMYHISGTTTILHIRIKDNLEASNEIIRMMMEQGWKLRGMTYERYDV